MTAAWSCDADVQRLLWVTARLATKKCCRRVHKSFETIGKVKILKSNSLINCGNSDENVMGAAASEKKNFHRISELSF